MTELKVSKDVAERDFERFAEAGRIDLEKPRNANDRTDLNEARELFIYHVMKGNITVDDEGYATVHTQCETLPEVKFGNRPRVINRRAIDRVKNTSQAEQQLALIADTVSVPTAMLNNLDEVDMEVVELVYLLFRV